MADQLTGLLSPFLRHRRIAAAKPCLRGRVLDFGCGVGSLCDFVPASRYLGVDRDAPSIEAARSLHPQHRFEVVEDISELGDERFDTIVSLAVIEHLPEPANWLKAAAALLESGGCIVLTTPHPNYEWIHALGARVRMFSAEAEEEHETLLDEQTLGSLGSEAGLRMTRYQRFLLGANQIAMFSPR